MRIRKDILRNFTMAEPSAVEEVHVVCGVLCSEASAHKASKRAGVIRRGSSHIGKR